MTSGMRQLAGAALLGCALGLCPAARSAADELGDLNSRGVDEFSQGDYREAVLLFSRALSLDPENEVVRRNLARSHFALGMTLARWEEGGEYAPEAVREMQRAIRIDPTHAEFHAALGRLHILGGHEGEAAGELERALGLNPQDAETASLLGEVAYREGELELAVEWWERAQRIDPHEPLASRRLASARRELAAEARFARRDHRHFVLRYDVDPEGIRARAEKMLGVLEEAYRYVGRELDVFPDDRVAVVVYEEPDFRSLTQAPHWSRGVYDGRIRVPYQGLAEDPETLRQVLFHEYTHAAVHHITRNRCPVWLNEGLAQFFAGEWQPEDAEFLESVERGKQLVPLELLEGSFLEAQEPGVVRLYYLESHAAVRYLLDRHGRWRMTRALKDLGEGKSMSQVLCDVYTLDYERLNLELARRIRWKEMR